MGCGVATPAVLGAASARVDFAVGVAEQVAVLRAALAILGVLVVLPLGRSEKQARTGYNLGVGASIIGNTTGRR